MKILFVKEEQIVIVQKRFEVELVVLVLITAHRAIKGPSEKGPSEKGGGAQHSIWGVEGGKASTPTKSISSCIHVSLVANT